MVSAHQEAEHEVVQGGQAATYIQSWKEAGPCTGTGRTPENHPEQRFPSWVRNPMTGPGPGAEGGRL